MWHVDVDVDGIGLLIACCETSNSVTVQPAACIKLKLYKN